MATTLPRSARRALTIIRHSPGITRHTLAETLHVSVTTINPVVSRLIDQKLVAEVIPTKDDRHGVGRPRAGLITPGATESVAILIWGHGVLTTAIATFDDRVVWKTKTRVEDILTADELVAASRSTLTATPGLDGIRPPTLLVLGLPAPYERGVGIGQSAAEDARDDAGFASWFSADPQALLSEQLGIRVIAENDANLGALGETARGAARGADAAIYLRLSGYGVGAGVTIRGQLFSGSHGYAGEIAHVRVDDTSGIICSCGSRGCLEEKIGPTMLHQLHANYGTEITYDDLLEMVERQLPGPTRLLQDAGRVAGRSLADICTFFNPGVLAIDAGSATASHVLIDGVREQIDQSTPPFVRRGLAIVPSELGEDAPLIGAVAAARVELLTTRTR
ncbi:MAG: ROK family transcriptional regulator [Propioniciclava sp.]